MAIKFRKNEPEAAPVEKAKKRDVSPAESTESSSVTASADKQSRTKSKKSGKSVPEKEDDLF